MKAYYALRACEYDATTYEALRRDPATRPDLDALEDVIGQLPPGRMLDVGCGTGWLTQHLRGSVTMVDQSREMLEIASRRNPDAAALQADVPPLPFESGSFDLALSSHVYSHLPTAGERDEFLRECRRVAASIVLVEQAPSHEGRGESWERRVLGDGSVHRVFKRYLTARELAAEAAGDVVLDNATFVVVQG